MAQAASSEEINALLTRLGQKSGVQSTLILSRQNGAIVRTSGLVSRSESANPESTLPASQEEPGKRPNGSTDAENKDITEGKGKKGGLRNAEDVARMVWELFGTAGGVVDEMMGEEDEVKLLRLRTKRNELVVVPDPKFLLVVIHDTPPA